MILWFYNNTGKLEQFSCSPLPVTVGRDHSCDLSIPDNSVSLKHASLSIINNKAILTDLGSTNGTFVNSLQIEKQALEEGDCIGLGRFKCWFGTGSKPGCLSNFILTSGGSSPFSLMRKRNIVKLPDKSNALREDPMLKFKKNMEKKISTLFDSLLVRILPWPEQEASPSVPHNLLQRSCSKGCPCLRIVRDKGGISELVDFFFEAEPCHTLLKIRPLKSIRHLTAVWPLNTRHFKTVIYVECYSPETISNHFFQALKFLMETVESFE
jgi:hypothetical protein